MLSEEKKWLAISGAAAIAGAAAVRFAMESGWRSVTGREPPENPAAPHVRWGEAIAWAVITGLTASLGRLIMERGTAAGWRRTTGRYPRALRRKRARR